MVTNSLLSYIVEKYKAQNKPLTAIFEITYNCNLSCIHCYASNQSLVNELTLAEIGNIAAEMKQIGIMDITLTGGEILARKDWYDVACIFKEMGFTITLFTNGTLINQEVINNFLQIKPIVIEVSQYGSSPFYYEKVAGLKGSFAKYIKGLELLHASGLNFVVKPIVLNQNFSDYQGMIAFTKNNGYQLRFSFCPYLLPNGNQQLDFRLSDDEMVEMFIQEEDENHISFSKCGIGQVGFVLGPTGDIRPCVAYPISAGNVMDQSLEFLWQESHVFQETREINLNDIAACKTCSSKEYCQPCLALNLLETGNILEPKENCRIAKTRMSALGVKNYTETTIK